MVRLYLIGLLLGWALFQPAQAQTTPTDSAQTVLRRSAFRHILLTGDAPADIQERLTRKLYRLPDSTPVLPVLNRLEEKYREKGYASAQADSVVLSADTLILPFFMGRMFRYDQLEVEGLAADAWEESGWERTLRQRKIFMRSDAEMRFSKILSYYQNRGYPFASLHKLEERIYAIPDEPDTRVALRYRFDPGKQYRIDSIRLEGKIRERPTFVYNLIRVKPGQLYRYQEIREIRSILNNSLYYQHARDPEEVFDADGNVSLNLKLESRKASRFDGLVGLLPPVDNTAKLQVTGLLDFVLVSPFASGEILAFKLEQLPAASQRLSLKYQQPWLFGLPWKAETELNLMKQDTTFLNRYLKLAPSWMLSQRVQLTGWFRNKTSVLLSTTQWKTSKLPPPVLDSRETMVGVGFEYEKLDYRLNPSRGLVFRLDAGAGTRNIRRNPGLDSFDYSSIRLTYPSREIALEARWFFSPLKRQVILLGNKSFRMDQAQYFRNELAQIGGARSLRGFNENQFFARYYSIFTLEYRFLLDENSNLFVFGDQGILEWREPGLRELFYPTGLGGGVNFDTKAGILNVTFATGRVGDIPFSPSRPRVHFGIISLF